MKMLLLSFTWPRGYFSWIICNCIWKILLLKSNFDFRDIFIRTQRSLITNLKDCIFFRLKIQLTQEIVIWNDVVVVVGSTCQAVWTDLSLPQYIIVFLSENVTDVTSFGRRHPSLEQMTGPSDWSSGELKECHRVEDDAFERFVPNFDRIITEC